MKFSLTSPTLILALSLGGGVANAHKNYRAAQHNAHAHQALAREAMMNGRNFLDPMFEHYVPRQATSVAGDAASPAGTSTVAAGVSSPAGSAAASSPAGSAAPAVSSPGASSVSYSYSLAATNPTAVPLASINSAAPSAPTHALPSSIAAGAKPSGIDNAPALPAASLVISNYPALDKIPPTDSPEVQQWVAEVKASGIEIPGFAPTNGTAACTENTAAAADTSRCWWTCTGCVRDTDVATCPDKNTWGLTYDDGPSPYTPDLLAYLDQQKLKATFFVTGSRVLSYPSILQYEYIAGHEISIHTWSHHALTTMTNEQIIAELGWTRKIIKDVLGVTPLTMRPPFGDIDDRVRAICQAMNLTPILWTRISTTQTLDTDDFDIHGGGATVDHVLFNWQNILGNVSKLDTGFIVLEHDLFQQAVEVATGYILPDALARNQFKIMPVQTCLGKGGTGKMGNSYLETNDNSSNPLPNSGKATNAQSGGNGSGNGAAGRWDTLIGGGLVGAGLGVLGLLV